MFLYYDCFLKAITHSNALDISSISTMCLKLIMREVGKCISNIPSFLPFQMHE